jgi:kinesin family protein 22
MQGTAEEPGIIPRVAQYLFDRVSDYPRNTVSIHVSYMEIYKELVYDLLIPREGVCTQVENTTSYHMLKCNICLN